MRSGFWCVVVLVGCATTQSGGAGSSGLPEACTGDLGAGEAQAKLATFVDAAGAFIGGVAALDGQLGAACRHLGADLQMTPAELEASGTDTASVCTQVAARVQAEMEKARGEASIEAKLE